MLCSTYLLTYLRTYVRTYLHIHTYLRLSSAERPVASMLFCGPTGVGKTELAKAVAELFFGDAKVRVTVWVGDVRQRLAELEVLLLLGARLRQQRGHLG